MRLLAGFLKIPEQRRVFNLIRAKVGLRGANESWIE